MSCRHLDVRKFDGVRCCLACGVAVFEGQQHAPNVQAAPAGALPQHQYTDLESSLGQEIRLVVILPGDITDPVECNIIHVNLEDDPYFEAVSYTWATEFGDDRKCKTVNLANGATLAVTENCEAVLRQLRLPSYERRLWIDALCINQVNIKERNHQVGLMDRIYHGARNVLISIPNLRTEVINGIYATHPISIPKDGFKDLFP